MPQKIIYLQAALSGKQLEFNACVLRSCSYSGVL